MSWLSAIPIISDIIDGGTKIIQEMIVDKDKKLEAEIALKKIALEAENKLMNMEHQERMSQMEINKLAVKSNDSFVRRARPATIWICNVALAYMFVGHPVGCWVLAVWFPGVAPPPLLDPAYLYGILGGLLGFGGYRSWEKVKGVTK